MNSQKNNIVVAAMLVTHFDVSVYIVGIIHGLLFLIFQVQSYERLLPLVPLEVPLGSFSNIRTGDCIVSFSRMGIYKLKVSSTFFMFFRLNVCSICLFDYAVISIG